MTEVPVIAGTIGSTQYDGKVSGMAVINWKRADAPYVGFDSGRAPQFIPIFANDYDGVISAIVKIANQWEASIAMITDTDTHVDVDYIKSVCMDDNTPVPSFSITQQNT